MSDESFDLLSIFATEATEQLEIAEQLLIAMTEVGATDETASHLFRIAHNLKGSGRAVGMTEVADFIHKVEDTINLIKKTPAGVPVCVYRAIMKCFDVARDYFRITMSGVTVAFHAGDTLRVLEESWKTPLVQEAVSAPVSKSKSKAKTPKTVQPTVTAVPRSASAQPVAESLKVEVEKLNRLLDSMGELVVYQNILNDRARKLPATTEFDLFREAVSKMRLAVKESQNISFALRMAPVRSVFQKLKRTVFDLSQALGKQVHLEIEGDHIELDKQVIEAISDPLTHLVRNALDHGIEGPEERRSAGKDVEARLRLIARQEADHVVIDVIEDGRGLQTDCILAKAIEKGIVSAGADLSEKEIFALIFANGFSTKDAVTDVSGRGVGMDVVKQTVDRLGGKIEINSKAGQGSTFRISLPLSVSVFDGMVFESSGRKFIAQLSSIQETLQIEDGKIERVAGRADVMNLRGAEIPMVSLQGLFGGAPETSNNALITRTGERPVGILVGRFVGVQQVVIKPLGPEFSQIRGLSGSAILGDGSIGIILDLQELVQSLSAPMRGHAA